MFIFNSVQNSSKPLVWSKLYLSIITSGKCQVAEIIQTPSGFKSMRISFSHALLLLQICPPYNALFNLLPNIHQTNNEEAQIKWAGQLKADLVG